MKLALVLSQCVCLLAILRTTPKPYRFTLAFLVASIPATALFKAESAWLHSWYLLLCWPVHLLRFVAGIEVAHRQTEGFRYWWRMMGTVFILAGMFTALAWVPRAPDSNHFAYAVELRRIPQIYLGAVFLVLEGFWLSQGGGWWRRADQIAVGFGLLALNHGAVSFICGVWRLKPAAWERVETWAWWTDAVCYLLLTLVFSGVPQFCLNRILARRSRRAGIRFPA